MNVFERIRKKHSFFEGMARVLDIGGTWDQPEEKVEPTLADYQAIMGDWEVVGNDLKDAMLSYAKAHPNIWRELYEEKK